MIPVFIFRFLPFSVILSLKLRLIFSGTCDVGDLRRECALVCISLYTQTDITDADERGYMVKRMELDNGIEEEVYFRLNLVTSMC